MKKYLLIPTLGLAFFFALAFHEPNNKYFEIVRNLDIFTTLYKEVNRYYVDEISPTQFMEVGIKAMLTSLDPYTGYIPEDKIEDYRTMTLGEYSGIGAQIHIHGEYAVITMPFEGYVAHRSGLRIGDQIMEINGQDMKNKTVDQLSKHLKGQSGTEISILVGRYGRKPFEVKLNREKIILDNVQYYGMVTEDVGLIQLTDFMEDAGKEVKNAVKFLKTQGAKSIILDLRGNPGGLLSEAINVSNVFVDKGREIVRTKGKVEEWNKMYVAPNMSTDSQIPVVVLINNQSASAAEIVAGVIQDYDRGVLIGKNSYGKGLVQATRSLSYNSKVKVTVAKYYIPSGRCIQTIDYSHRNQDGTVDKFPDSLRTMFKTRNGRVVYDGAGIMPDLSPKYPDASELISNLKSENIIFDYATHYRERHDTLVQAKKFQLSDAEYNTFLKWLANKNYDYATSADKLMKSLEYSLKEKKYYKMAELHITALKKQIESDKKANLHRLKDQIREALEQEIVSRYFWHKGSIESEFDNDPDIQEALKLFKDLDRYYQILATK